jgi:hypothetical protein
VYPTDLEPSDRWYEPGTDLIDLSMSASGTMHVPGGPMAALETDGMNLVCEIT